jgi:cell division protein FtsW (lipid II flippase)/DNA-binding transcriptional regulator YdaS (Cro superfamily)
MRVVPAAPDRLRQVGSRSDPTASAGCAVRTRTAPGEKAFIKWWALPAAIRRSAPIARIERLGLALSSLVVLLGVSLTYVGQTRGFEAVRRDVAGGRVVNLESVTSGAALAPALRVFDQQTERTEVASAIVRRLRAPDAPALTHVGGLAAVTIPASAVRRDARLAVLNERLRAHPTADAVPLLTSADIVAIKPGLIARSPAAYTRQVAIALAVVLAAFWASHIIRSLARATGDPIVLPVIGLLTGIGFASMLALRDPLRDSVLVVPYAGGIAAGVALFSAIAFVDFEAPRLRRAVLAPLAAATLLAAALLVFGSGPSGSDAKVNLLGVQPVEAIRLLAVFSLAAYFARRWQFLREFSDTVAVAVTDRRVRVRVPRWKDVRPLAITIATLLTFFFLQKDLGPALVLSCVFLGVYGIARARTALVVCGFAALTLGFGAGFVLGVPATVTRRVTMWLDPWNNAMAGGDQVAHALWAFATGSRLGVGPGMGDPQLIPAGHTDLVLAAVGEELGFVGVLAVIGLLGLLVWRMLRAALRAPGDYTCFLAAGLCLVIAVQALVIAAGVLGLLPLAGVVTPFLSYGRSSMLSNFAAVGICCAIARRAGPVRESFARPIRTTGRTLAAAAMLVVTAAGLVQVARADGIASRGNVTRQADGGYRYQYNPRLLAAARQIERGTIYDRAGVPLATSRPEELQSFANELRTLGAPIPSGCDDPRSRCYPLAGLAFHVVGESEFQTNWAARNTSFVEREFDARLKGFDDAPRTVLIRDPQGHTTPGVVRDLSDLLPLARHPGNAAHPAVRRIMEAPRDVRLTLDARLQIRVARALEAYASRASGRGAAVVLDATSGQILAAASYPWPDFERFGVRLPSSALGPGKPDTTYVAEQLLDRARYGLYPPGSTFKLITAAAALRSDPAAARTTFQCSRLEDGRVGGRVRGASKPIRDDPLDHAPHGTLDLHQALVVSCNAYFANLATTIGARALGETASAAQIAAAPPPADENLRRSLPYAGYGQGLVLASPLRMTRVASAIASGGALHDVRVALEPSQPDVPPTRWISASAADQLGRDMREVVMRGTGRALAGHQVPIAGKTGTAEVDGAPSHSWFVGFAPYRGEGRTIAFAVILENAGYGGRAAASLAGEIVQAAGALE